MTKKNPYLWPKGALLVIRDRYGEICRSSNRRFDLADAIMLSSPTSQRTVSLDMRLLGDVQVVDEEEVENLIRYDLGFDGYNVTITRADEPTDTMVLYEWKLRVRPV